MVTVTSGAVRDGYVVSILPNEDDPSLFVSGFILHPKSLTFNHKRIDLLLHVACLLQMVQGLGYKEHTPSFQLM